MKARPGVYGPFYALCLMINCFFEGLWSKQLNPMEVSCRIILRVKLWGFYWRTEFNLQAMSAIHSNGNFTKSLRTMLTTLKLQKRHLLWSVSNLGHVLTDILTNPKCSFNMNSDMNTEWWGARSDPLELTLWVTVIHLL